jgi:hypothetical protein
MYKSPIEVIYGQMQTQLEGDIFRTVQNYGINVDKDELIKALAYDRNQYDVGYRDALDTIVRCKDCVYWQDNNGGYPHEECRWDKDETPDADDYCSFGEKIDGKGGTE